MIFSLRHVAEKVCERNQELFTVFIDLTKAFDTVNRGDLRKVLKKLGIPDNMLNVGYLVSRRNESVCYI